LWPGQAVAACSGVRVMPPGPAVPIAAVASSVLDRPQPFLPEWLLSRWPAPSAATPAPIASALRVAVMLLYLVDPDSRQRRLSGPVREAGSAADRAHRSSVAHRGSLGGDNALGGGPGTVECPKWTDAAAPTSDHRAALPGLAPDTARLTAGCFDEHLYDTLGLASLPE